VTAKVYIRPERPQYVLRATEYTWHDRDGTPTPGVGLFVDHSIVQHLTPEQAIQLADQLVDAAETISNPTAAGPVAGEKSW
jgi:hypothetical protein